ncbi:hypothetical protein CBR_g37617 [Chara braunii]|uniref:FLZ-type domain-containing protein n=1 Tax=Chara braunii TaxID=69332 RepID=A0A388LNB3_CHABU|nr:hypothetical protein CBR_g37617 [Chara braunii]|eukprot:GBG83817.1 hypothetical protein CBR_g37617 [Chara braunii]
MVRTAAYGKLGVGFDSSSTVTYQLRRNAANKPPSTESCNGQPVSSKNVLWRTDPSATSAATTTAGYISGAGSRDVSNRDRDVVDWMMAVKTSHHHSSSSSSAAAANANSSMSMSNANSSHPSGNHHHSLGGNSYHHHNQRYQEQQQQQQHQTRGYGGAGVSGAGGVPGFAAGFGGLFKIKPAAAHDSRELRTTSPATNTSASSASIAGAGFSRSNLSSGLASREEKKREMTKAASNKYEYGRSSLSSPGAYSGPGSVAVQRKQEKSGGDDDNRNRGARPVSPSSNESQGAARPPVSVAVVIPTTGGGDWSGGKKGFDLGDTTYFSRPSRGTSGSSSPSSPSSPFSPFSTSSVSSSSSSSPSQSQPHPLPNFPYDFSYSTRGYENKLCEGLERGLYGLSSAPYWPSTYGQEPRRTGIAAAAGLGGGYYEQEREADSGAGFMSVCDLCAKRLGQNADIYIYRGEKAFCSAECRQQVIQADQASAASNTCGSAPATVGRRGARVGLI